MEAATKNKRGRPRKHDIMSIEYEWEEDHNWYSGGDAEIRSKVNYHYASTGLSAIYEIYGTTEERKDSIKACFGLGKIKKVGVLEQVGRITESGDFTEDEIENTVYNVIFAVIKGYKCKDLEKQLRQYRTDRKRGNQHGESTR